MIACRACSLQTSDFTSIYSKYDDTTLADILQTLVPLQIPDPSDGVLTVICSDCIERTLNAYRFVQVVRQANCYWASTLPQRDSKATECEAPIIKRTIGIELVAYSTNVYDDEEYLLEDDKESDKTSMVTVEDGTSTEPVATPPPSSVGLKHLKYFPKLANGSYRCCGRRCLLTFSNREALELHGVAEHGEQQRKRRWGDSFQYECMVCYCRFKQRRNLLNHLRRLVRDFQCPVCRECFDRPRKKQDHMHQLHPGYLNALAHKSHRLEVQPMKICCGCGAQFETVEKLMEHGRNEHPSEPTFSSEEQSCLRCKVCSKLFRTQATLQKHQRSVYQAKPFSCGQCGESFRYSSRLETHEQVHASERNFVCETCGAAFKTKVGLAGHVSTHQERRFQCTECDYRAGKSSRLVMHMRKHSEEKPFICQQCQKRFRSKSNLTSHMRSHTGDKSYQCRYCVRRYVYASDRAKHERLHTGDLPYGCSDCDKKFMRPCLLKAHGKVCKKVRALPASDPG